MRPHARSAPVVALREAPRSIRFLHLHDSAALSLKVYGITRPGTSLPSAAVGHACTVASSWHATHWCDATAPSPLRDHGLGFLIVHMGVDGLYVVLAAWADDNLLRQRVWRAPLDTPTALTSLSEVGIMACVWELAVIAHERDVWVRTMLDGDSTPDPARYLADVLDLDC